MQTLHYSFIEDCISDHKINPFGGIKDPTVLRKSDLVTLIRIFHVGGQFARFAIFQLTFQI